VTRKGQTEEILNKKGGREKTRKKTVNGKKGDKRMPCNVVINFCNAARGKQVYLNRVEDIVFAPMFRPICLLWRVCNTQKEEMKGYRLKK
jgi:hypothetical protein